MTDSAQKPTKTGYADINGLRLYYEMRGQPRENAGTPLVVLHGGLHNTALDAPVAEQLARRRPIIAVDLQAHGRTADIDRPLRYEQMADDIAGLLAALGLEQVDLLGYSLGGGVALQTAIRHPARVRKLVLVSVPFASNGWYPEIQQAFQHFGSALAEPMRPSPVYQTYAAVAPRPEQFPQLLDKMGELQRRSYDWSPDVARLAMPAMLVYADADSFPPAHIVRFFELLGGGQRDAGWDGSAAPRSRLAILPGRTHYNVFESPELIGVVEPFLDAR
jgi:pimeloyl-ACP methyl ester carboxylesterase